MSSETYAIPFDDNETIDSGTSVLSNDQIQTIMESGDTTLSYPFELDFELPSVFQDLFQDQLPVSEQTVDHQILVSNQPERNVRFR